MDKIKVSVIIPIYNSEKYIEKCVRALFEQTLEEVEYIFIDDKSTDNGIKKIEEIVSEYPKRAEQIKIIRNKENNGVSRSRQRGVEVAKGEYIIHCDSDDWTEPSMYEEMYNEGVRRGANIIGCDFVEEFPERSEYRKQDFLQNGEEICKGILERRFHSGLWCRMVKREFINSLDNKFWPDVSYMEDTLYIFPLHLNNKDMAYIPKGLYHYRQVEGSLTHTLNLRQLESALFVMTKIGEMIGGKESMTDSFQKGMAYHAQGLITRLDSYSPKRWRELTENIPISYFGSFSHRLSPILVRMHLGWVNKLLIKVLRSGFVGRIRTGSHY